MPAVAVTDQSNLFSVIKFYQAAVRAKIKPIIGVDIWIENKQKPKEPTRATLLCQNNQGYQNLLKLVSASFIEGQASGKAIVQYARLSELNEGLIVLSGATKGDLGLALIKHDHAETENALTFWKRYFPNRYYIELSRTGLPNQEAYIALALDIAEKELLPVIATNNVRFLEQDEFEAHEARVCIHNGTTLADPRRSKNYTEQQYFRSAEEMTALFSDIPDALSNTVELAKRCTVTLTLNTNILPRFPIPPNITLEDYFCRAAEKGLEGRLQNGFTHPREEYDARLKRELDVINEMGFAGYFLIVADFTRWSRENGVPVGPGRGSGPGSLVAYALGITDLDPLVHELLFERFLNPERVSLPDFDIDFCMEGRDRVIEYVMEKYGRHAVAQIITYGTMTAKAVIRDVGRVLGMSYGHVDKIAKLIPFELGITLDKALQDEPLLFERYNNEEEVRTLIDLAKKLEGITRNASKHAGGVVIAPSHLTDFTPLYCEEGESTHTVTQFDKYDIETVGLVKFDFLGLRTLTIIDWAIQDINRSRKEKGEPPLDIHRIPLDDAPTFALLKACLTTAVFQLESRGMKDLVKRLQPDCFEDISALVALFRPGPLQSGMVDDFIHRKHGRSQVSFLHPALESILRPTYGIILYQEQVMQIAQVLAGYSLGSADLLRRAMGKKKPEEMAEQREVFCKGAVERGVALDNATYIFDLMEKFAGYGFNKPHAASYALIAYQTAWLKTHYTARFMAAVLSADMDNTDKVVYFIEECRALGLCIQPPNINQSDYTFKALDEKNIAYGLGAIKGAGQSAIEAMMDAREQGEFNHIFDFYERIDPKKMNRRVLDALTKAGAFDTIGPHRASIEATFPLALKNAEKKSRDQRSGQGDLFGESDHLALDYVSAPTWNEQTRLLGEKATLGLYLTGHPIHRYLPELVRFTKGRLNTLRPSHKKTVTLAGIVTQIRTLNTKKGDKMAVVTLDDNTTTLDVLCFSEQYNQYRSLLIKDQLIIVEGEISLDEFSGGYRVLSREIYAIETARERFAKHVQLSLSPQTDMIALMEILSQYRGGQCRLSLNYVRPDAKASLTVGDTWKIKPSDALLNTLREMLDAGAVEVIY